jgi:hypothetical protein
MPPGIGASGILGVALEAVSGTYVAPTKFVPFESENLQYMQDTIMRRPIRQSADIIGTVPGNVHTEGDIGMEALTDCVLFFLHAARHTVVKTGAGPYTYTFTPNALALPVKTLSLTVVRNGVVYGYTGLVVGQFVFTIEEGLLKFNCSMVGADEAVQSAPTPTWPTTTPYGAGMYTIEIPTAAAVFDCDGFTFTVNHNPTPQYRLKGGGARGAQFVNFGENNTTMSTERDFVSRAEYDAYKALTSQSITLKAIKVAASEEINILMPASIKETYEVTMPSQGELVRASVTYQMVVDSTGKAYEITVIHPTENIIP